jgi:hypothetical protein
MGRAVASYCDSGIPHVREIMYTTCMLPKTEQVWRHLLVSAAHGERRWPNLAVLAGELGMPVSTIHRALARPAEIGAVEISPRGGVTTYDPGVLQICWAGRRRLVKDITHRFRVTGTAYETEALLGEDPRPLILGGHGAVIAATGPNTIANYSTVLVYGEPFIPALSPDDNGTTEVIVLDPDPLLARYGRTTPLCQAWTDLFCLPNWQAARFTHYLIPEVIKDAA